MNANRATRLAGFLAAILITLVIHGALLWKFDSVAQEGALASRAPGPAVVALESATIPDGPH
ncbi:MAG: hypothetical protein ACOYNZ_02140 [Rhodoferax sp.]